MNGDVVPRSYQIELMKIALEKNTIIFLPTGAGKIFIALLVLKRMSGDLQKSYSEGGKISIILVNTLASVDHHEKYIRDHTTLKVGRYTNLEQWSSDEWKKELDLIQVLIVTSQVLVSLTNQNFIDLKKVNLIIFDQCQQSVNDQHIRQLMKLFGEIDGEKPRVLGLTAPLLNANVKPHMVMDDILALETTYHSKVVTVSDLTTVVGYLTNPREELKICRNYHLSFTEVTVIKSLTEAKLYMKSLKLTTFSSDSKHFLLPKPDITLRKLSDAIDEAIVHIKSMGTYGGLKAILTQTIQIERLKQNCSDSIILILNYIQSVLSFVKELLFSSIKMHAEKDQIFCFSSDKVLVLLNILKEYKSKEDMCCSIFTERPFTAKVVFQILAALSKCDPDFSHIKVNFMVSHNSSIRRNTRESLFISKKNTEILDSFINKEINVLVASNVLEEGVNIPGCNLVIKYDKPEDYSAYIQSKGRARHKDSIFYIFVEEADEEKYRERYKEFQSVEQTLNNYLIHTTDERSESSQDLVRLVCEEDAAQPPNSLGAAGADSASAIAMLRRYCRDLPCDPYTAFSPEWYAKRRRGNAGDEEYSVSVVLPTVCPLADAIEGPFMKTIKHAKRTAALKTCRLLHQLGELDDRMLPKKHDIKEEDVGYLFKHYPTSGKTSDGSLKTKRLHKKLVAGCLCGQIEPASAHYLHVIELQPRFQRRSEDVNSSTMYDAYASASCFGFVTRSALPTVCDFPVFVTMGAIEVRCAMNRKSVTFTQEEVRLIRTFHFRVFDEVLAVLQPFLTIDNDADAEMLMLVPVDKTTLDIDFEMIKEKSEVKRWTEPSTEEKLTLEVTQETHLRQIVVPWYRTDAPVYVVTEVSLNRSARSPFPNHDYGDFKSYFEEKHHIRIVSPDLPQLLVKALTRRLNFVRPVANDAKKRREKTYDESVEYLLPELVVKQDFPAPLWIQASLLPTILSRLISLLAIEDVRCKIAEETLIGRENIVLERRPLRLDENLLHYQPHMEEDLADDLPSDDSNTSVSETGGGSLPPGADLRANRDFEKKLLESQYSWKDEDEPNDVDRDLTATVMDVAHYEAFMTHPVTGNLRSRNEYSAHKFRERLALTYPRHYSPCRLRMLERSAAGVPELCELYRAVTAAQADDIVNSERFKTLGNSFLKYVATAYIFRRFPAYDEGRVASLRGRLLSNRNLYYLAVRKNLDGILRSKELSPRDEWLPPGFAVPREMRERIDAKELSINALFGLSVSADEQISGELSEETRSYVRSDDYDPEEKEDCYHSMAGFLRCQYVGDKGVADVVEAMLGAFVDACGPEGGLKFIQWVGIIPSSEKLEKWLSQPPPDPVLSKFASPSDIERHIPNWRELEEIIGYEFKNPAYLLQALTHASFTFNRTTASYKKLELVGEAILDFLITSHIFETCDGLDPGQLADLRSALVNNNTFAGLLVRNNVHKFVLMVNSNLQGLIDKFVRLMEQKNFEIDDEVLILLEEDDNNSTEAIDVPKILGDVFEAIAGAVYFDSNNNLETVWDVFYKIMWKEIDLFSHSVPKNIVKRLFDWPGAHPEFGAPQPITFKKCMVPLSFMLNGTPKAVHGFGTNKTLAKKAAAKLALRFLDLDMSKH